MPKGRARRALRANFDKYANQLCDTIYRDNGPTIELTKAERKLAKLTKDPESAFTRSNRNLSKIFPRRLSKSCAWSLITP